MDGNDAIGNAPPPKEVANDFFGKACPSQPGGDQLLMIPRNQFSNGCDLQSFAPPAPGSNDLDVLGLYKELRPSVDYFVVKGEADGKGKVPAGTEQVWSGSGATVAREASDCLVLTDDHVPLGAPEQHVKPTSLGVVMADGKTYDGTVISRDPAHDLAIVKADTGADTDKVCRPVAVTENEVKPDGTQNIITMGQPFTSHSVYVSTGSLSQMQKRDSINYMIKPLPGEDPNRDIISMFMPIREGFSGGADFDKTKQIVSVNDLQTSPFSSVSTPVTRAMVDDMIAHRSDKPAGK